MVYLYPVFLNAIIGLFSPVQTPATPATQVKPKNEIKLTNLRLTYGEFGATRLDAKYLGGDVFCVAFDIEGITLDDSGKVSYGMGMELVDKDNKSIWKQPAIDREEILVLGGNRLPARAYVTIGTGQTPGVYTCKLTVMDRATGAAATLEQKLEVVPKNLGLIAVYTSHDERGDIGASPIGVVGQSIWLHCAAVNFERNAAKQPDVEVEMAVFEKGSAVLKKPIKLTIDKNVDPKLEFLPMNFLIPLSRPGTFAIELKVTDKLSKKVNKVTIPFRVLDANER